MTFTLKDVYVYYKASGGQLSKYDFKNICSDFNIHIMEHIIYQGKWFKMPKLGVLRIAKVKRRAKNKDRLHAIDWKASNEYKQELINKGIDLYDHSTGKGQKWLIYRESDYYARFYWNFSSVSLVNKSYYKFIATRGEKGNKDKLKEFLNEHECNIDIYHDTSIYK